MQDISLDQYIKNTKIDRPKGGSRARRLSTEKTSTTSSPRRNNNRSLKIGTSSSPVKFTARLDTKSATSKPSIRPTTTTTISRPPRPSRPTSTTTTTTSSTSSIPALKITIQNNNPKPIVRTSSPPLRSGRIGDVELPRIRITKSIDRIQDRSTTTTKRPNDIDSRKPRIKFNNNNNSRNSGDFLSGDGPTLFERQSRNTNRGTHVSNHHQQQQQSSGGGRGLQLFTGSRLNISNLHHAIVENDLKVLFDSIGDIKQIKVNFDHSGRSDGTGFVIFSRHNDAITALQKYDGAVLDGKPLKITTGPSLQQDVRNIF